MNKRRPYLLLFTILLIISCSASGEPVGKSPATSSFSLPALQQCTLEPSFVDALVKQGFTISVAELIKKAEIPRVPDNIKSVKRLFQGQEEVFNGFSTLNRYHIKKNNSKVSANFYCFTFSQNNTARTWFEVVDKTPYKTNRLVIFSKPKKLMALSKNHVYLVEGYYIANFDVLNFLMAQLPEVDAVLGPK